MSGPAKQPGVFFCFGMGFVGRTLGRLLLAESWRVIGTARSEAGCENLRAQGFEAVVFTGEAPGEGVVPLLSVATHMLNSVPPGEAGDPVLIQHSEPLADAVSGRLEWIGLLSTVGVYGEHHGDWVDENTPPAPIARRSRLRLKAEQAWREFAGRSGLPLHVFRLPGIYGPGRNQLESVRRGKARRLVKPGQVFNRAHVEDIALVLKASMAQPQAGSLYNVCDDEPAPPQDVVTYACELLNMPPPPLVRFEDAKLSPMARSFYGECKRVRNDRIKRELGVRLTYPTYREGLRALRDTLD